MYVLGRVIILILNRRHSERLCLSVEQARHVTSLNAILRDVRNRQS